MSNWLLDRGRKYGVFPNGDGPLSQVRGATRYRGIGPWHNVGDANEPAFQNGWVNVFAWEPVSFCIDDYGIVHVNFGMTNRNTGSGGTIFTLPSGYRPSVRTSLLAMIGTSISFPVKYGRLDVTTGGAMIVQSDAKCITAGDLMFRKA